MSRQARSIAMERYSARNLLAEHLGHYRDAAP
jgi:hypothetical protein